MAVARLLQRDTVLMFKLRTGTPGAGKTLSIIDELRHTKDRKIYYYGIPQLSPDLGWIELENPLDYHNEIIDGSIVVIDECQKHFPVRPPKLPVPPAIAFIETHRHRGIDIYFITQHPNLLDHHARRLVGEHVHLQRNFGMPFAVKYTNNKLFDYSNYHELQTCQQTNYRYPKEVFALYKSAEVHTHKVRLPKKLLIIPVLLAMVAYGVYTVYNLFGDKKAGNFSPVPAYQIDHSGNAPGKQSGTASAPVDWLKAMTPAVKGMPYTAPLYAELAKPVAMPVIAGCISNWQKCRCYTQQATVVDVDEGMCRSLAKHHAFNPFKAPTQVAYGEPGQGRQYASPAFNPTRPAPLPSAQPLTNTGDQ